MLMTCQLLSIYPDDSGILVSGKCQADVEHTLEEDLHLVKQWIISYHYISAIQSQSYLGLNSAQIHHLILNVITQL
jgi:hypothetical protein